MQADDGSCTAKDTHAKDDNDGDLLLSGSLDGPKSTDREPKNPKVGNDVEGRCSWKKLLIWLHRVSKGQEDIL